jgi:hypothetical protein
MRWSAAANARDVGVELVGCRISESILSSKRSPRCVRGADGSELTPRDIGHAVKSPTPRKGQLIFRVFAAALVDDEVERQESLQEILRDFERDAAEWAGRLR